MITYLVTVGHTWSQSVSWSHWSELGLQGSHLGGYIGHYGKMDGYLFLYVEIYKLLFLNLDPVLIV